MEYESSRYKSSPTGNRFFAILNFILLIIIAFCINYFVVDFLF